MVTGIEEMMSAFSKQVIPVAEGPVDTSNQQNPQSNEQNIREDGDEEDSVDKIDLDKSGTVSFYEYVKMFATSKTDKRQSLAKSVFTKAVEVLRVQGSGGASHTFSIEERNAFSNHINSSLKDDKDVLHLLPLRPESSDLFGLCGPTGIVFTLFTEYF